MKVNQYRESDMRRAMQRIREDMGADAVIISTRKVGKQVEVLAATDYDDEIASRLQANLPGSGEVAQTMFFSEPEAEPAAVMAGADVQPMLAPELSGMQAELSRLRGLFENEFAELTWQDKGRRQPGRLGLQMQLEELGLSRELCQQLLDQVDFDEDAECSWQSLLDSLSQRIDICDHNLIERGGCIALVGPTGVGKTTTIAKLAARFALRHGRNQVALITTDRFRVGAQEQLYTFGSLLGVPVQAASNAADLSQALQSVSGRKLVLIDTAGMSHRDIGLTDQFATLAGADVEIETYLVQSAVAQEQVMNDIVQAFSHVGLAGAIVTKIDEAASLGHVISNLCKHRLPLAFVGNGQRVPEDILPARPNLLVEEAVKLMQSYRQDDQFEAMGAQQYV